MLRYKVQRGGGRPLRVPIFLGKHRGSDVISVSFEDSSLAADAPPSEDWIRDSVAAFLILDYSSASVLISQLTGYFSDIEEQVLQEGVSMAMFVDRYREFQFDRMIWVSLQNSTEIILESLIPHIHQIMSFPEFRQLFTEHFFLEELLNCFLSYTGDHYVQFSLILSVMLDCQLSFDHDLTVIYNRYGNIMDSFRDHSAPACLAQFLYSLARAVPAILDQCSRILESFMSPTDEYCLHLTYRVLTIMVRQSADDSEIGLLLDHDVNVYLLRKPDEDSPQLIKDRVKYFTALMRRFRGNALESRFLLLGHQFDFDFDTMAAVEDPDLLPYVLELFSAVIDCQPHIMLEKVVPDRMIDILVGAVEDGGFELKKQALLLLDKIVSNGFPAFNTKVITHNDIFLSGIDVIRFGTHDLVLSYINMIEHLLIWATHIPNKLRKILEELSESELDEAILGQVGGEDQEVGQKALALKVRIDSATMDCQLFSSW
jgi:hypothetical protein